VAETAPAAVTPPLTAGEIEKRPEYREGVTIDDIVLEAANRMSTTIEPEFLPPKVSHYGDWVLMAYLLDAFAEKDRRIAEQSEGYKSIEAWFTAEKPDLEPRPDDHWHLRELKLFVADYAARIAELERERDEARELAKERFDKLVDRVLAERNAIARATAEKARADAAEKERDDWKDLQQIVEKKLNEYIIKTRDAEDALAAAAADARDAEARADAVVERERVASAALERDRTRVADAYNGIMKAISSRSWLRESRGSYEWNDDRWMGEFGEAIDEIEAAAAPLRKIAADWSGCPTDPAEIKAARAALSSPAPGNGEADHA
jgi:hypothetical protein